MTIKQSDTSVQIPMNMIHVGQKSLLGQCPGSCNTDKWEVNGSQ